MTTVMVAASGERLALDVERWRDTITDEEWAVLSTLPDPVLDIGCGPGRIVVALANVGRMALGIDPSTTAIVEARARGAPVLHRSVFDRVPGEGRWGGAVLLDGNIGIGGDVAALLERVRRLLRAGGRLVAEVGAPGGPTERLAVRLERASVRTQWFPWARVAADRFPVLARTAGLEPDTLVRSGDRWFASAVRP